MTAETVPEGPCERCGTHSAQTPDGVCERCAAKRARWRRAQAASRQRKAAGDTALPDELVLGRAQVHGLAEAVRALAAAQSVLDDVGHKEAADPGPYDKHGVNDALWALAYASDDALALLRQVLPPGIVPPESADSPA